MVYSLNFDAVMQRIKQAKKMNKDKDAALFLGISVNSYSNRKRTGAIPYEEICHACTEENMNIDWVLTGDGKPFKDSGQWVAPVAEIAPALLAEIMGELTKAFDGDEDRERLQTAAQRGALSAQIFNKVAFIKVETVRSGMIRDQAKMLAEAAKWLV